MAGTAHATAPEQAEVQRREIDFKMVTFSLGGKDYGIDIMRIKEIARFAQFTYVPNTARYVRGVYNLRGDIISVIDLRLMFNLPAVQREKGQSESGLILRLDNHLLGVVVDSIDRVVGLSSSQVQPPHPIFGDINVKYINGVVQHEDRLYIILDVDRIFSKDDPRGAAIAGVAAPEQREPAATMEMPAPQKDVSEDVRDQRFLEEGLAAYIGFHVSPVNRQWFEKRAEEWIASCAAEGRNPQFSSEEDARSFIAPFFSQITGRFWPYEYLEEIAAQVQREGEGPFNIWNPGTSAGHEAYSLAMMTQEFMSNRPRKVWASDKDLIKVSSAPNLEVELSRVDASLHQYLQENTGGRHVFVPEIRDTILFEFSDIANGGSRPPMDLIVARDVVSFVSRDVQDSFFQECTEVLKPGGMLMLGDHEQPMDESQWARVSDSLALYRRR